MATQLDFKGIIKAYPYIKPSIASSTVPQPVASPEALPILNSPQQMFLAQDLANASHSLDVDTANLKKFVNQIPTDVSELGGGIFKDLFNFDDEATKAGQDSIGKDTWNVLSESVNLGVPVWLKNLVGTEEKPGPLKKTLKTLGTITDILGKVLTILSLFVEGFNSFSMLMKSIITLVQEQIKKFADEALKAGVYITMIAPEAFFEKPTSNNRMEKFLRSYGGYQAFLGQLNAMLHNKSDKNAPPFTSNLSYMGGAIVLIDSTTLDEIWSALKTLGGMFTFAKLFGLHFEPPAPSNLTGSCAFKVVGEAQTFGVKLEWDNPFIASTFVLSRSRVQGGQKSFQPYFPDSLLDDKKTKQPGLITVTKAWLSSIGSSWTSKTKYTAAERRAQAQKNNKDIAVGAPLLFPEKLVTAYIDPSFNKGKSKVVVGGVDHTVTYFDSDIKLYKGKAYLLKTGKTDPLAGANSSQELNEAQFALNVYEPVSQLFYVVQSSTAMLLKGPFSQETSVIIKTCNDSYNATEVVEQANGRFTIFSTTGMRGALKLNTWSVYQVNLMVPWIPEIVKFFDKILNTLKGGTANASDAFIAFVNQLIDKVNTYIQLVNVIAYLISMLQNFAFGPSFAFLNLPPKQGGVDVLMERIRRAKLPPLTEEERKMGVPERAFSGPDGITIGLVILYGAGGDEASQKIIGLTETAIGFIANLFKKK